MAKRSDGKGPASASRHQRRQTRLVIASMFLLLFASVAHAEEGAYVVLKNRFIDKSGDDVLGTLTWNEDDVDSCIEIYDGENLITTITDDGTIDWTRGDWTGSNILIDATNATGTPGLDDWFFTGGDYGGYFDRASGFRMGDIALHVLNVRPVLNGQGAVGDDNAEWGQGNFEILRSTEELTLPPSVYPDVSGETTVFNFSNEDILKIQTGGVGYVLIGEESANKWARFGSSGKLSWIDQGQSDVFFEASYTGQGSTQLHGDGKWTTTNVSTLEFSGLEGALLGAGYDQTNEADDVITTLGFQVPVTIWGSKVVLKKIHLEIQTPRAEDYVSKVAIWERSGSTTGVNQQWFQNITLGQGVTTYQSASYTISPTVTPIRYWWIELTSVNGNTVATSVQYSRVAIEYELLRN